MPGHGSISAEKLFRLMGTPTTPHVVDVRVPDDFDADARLLPASTRISHEFIAAGRDMPTDSPVIVVCQRGAKLSQGVAAILRGSGLEATSLEGGFEAWRDAGLPLVPHRHLAKRAHHGGTRWVTRHRPKIDRVACPWLIRRFVDPKAEFLFVPPDDVAGVAERFDAVAFDMPEGFWTHRDNGCTFDTMVEEFGLKTEALMHLSSIVRAADTDRLANVPEAAGLLAVSLGLSRQFSDDLAQMHAGFVVYDALYRWCRDATAESHNWPARNRDKT